MDPHDAATGVTSDPEDITSIALWLLRLGADVRGQLSLGPPWDLAVRVAVLIDLRAAGRIADSDTTIYIDEGTPDGDHEDVACHQLLTGGLDSETAWVDRGRLRARDVARPLLTSGEWRSRMAPTQPGGRMYRARRDEHVRLRQHLRDVASRSAPARSPQEFSLLVLCDLLFGLAGGAGDLELRWAECGPYRDLVEHTCIRIRTRAAMAQLGMSAGGGG